MRIKKESNNRAHMGRIRIRCNLCGKPFRCNSRHMRFCRTCRTEDEIFLFSEWMVG